MAELEQRTHLSAGRIRPLLNRLRHLGACHRDGDGGWTLLRFDPDSIAKAIGTYGKAARRRRVRDREWAARRMAVDAWAEERRREDAERREAGRRRGDGDDTATVEPRMG